MERPDFEARVDRLYRSIGTEPPHDIRAGLAALLATPAALDLLARVEAIDDLVRRYQDVLDRAFDVGHSQAALAASDGETDPGMIRHRVMELVYGDDWPDEGGMLPATIAEGVEAFLAGRPRRTADAS